MDRIYAELVDYQEQLERQNAELSSLRRFMDSVLASVSDVLIVVDPLGRVEEASRSLWAARGGDRAGTVGHLLADLVAAPSRDALQRAMIEVLRFRRGGTVEVELLTTAGRAPSVPEEQAEAALSAMRSRPEGQGAALVGRVSMRTAFGGARIVDMLAGEQLPRIC